MQKVKQLTRWKQQRLEIRESVGCARPDEKGRKRREEGKKLVLQFGFFFQFRLLFFFSFSLQRQESVKNELPAIAALQFAVCSALELAQNLLCPAKPCSSDYHRETCVCVSVCVCVCVVCACLNLVHNLLMHPIFFTSYISAVPHYVHPETNGQTNTMDHLLFVSSQHPEWTRSARWSCAWTFCLSLTENTRSTWKVSERNRLSHFSDMAQLLFRTSRLFLL